MKKAELEEIDQLFKSVLPLVGKICRICKKEYGLDKLAWVLHHNQDYKHGEKKYSDFKMPNGVYDRLNYYRYLIPIVKQDPKRFDLMHHKCHWMAGNLAQKTKIIDELYLVAKEMIIINQIEKERKKNLKTTDLKLTKSSKR